MAALIIETVEATGPVRDLKDLGEREAPPATDVAISSRGNLGGAAAAAAAAAGWGRRVKGPGQDREGLRASRERRGASMDTSPCHLNPFTLGTTFLRVRQINRTADAFTFPVNIISCLHVDVESLHNCLQMVKANP